MPAAHYDVWHDRAVFHFLTDPADRARYVAQVLKSVKPGGHVIVAAFGPGGPLQCSGLDVVRYAPDALHAEFGAPFRLLGHETEIHHTPAGKEQEFVYCYCVRDLIMLEQVKALVREVAQREVTPRFLKVAHSHKVGRQPVYRGGFRDAGRAGSARCRRSRTCRCWARK